MFWGCITYDKMGPFIEIRGNLNSQDYISQILETFRGFWRKFQRKNKTGVFMQDNAPCHTSKLVEKWFGSNKVRKILWPQSPDQNPIETVWDMLLRAIRNRKKQPTSLTDLREALKNGWLNFPMEEIRKLYDGLPNRIDQIKKMKGNATKY